MKYLSLILSWLLLPTLVLAMGKDDPLLFMLKMDQLELRDADDHTPLVWETQAWLGKDLNKLYFKTEGERVNGDYEELETQLLYSHAIAPYWDMQVGWRHDAYPKPNRDWFAIGLQGLTPYYFEIDVSLFVGDEGRTALRLSTEYELMLTQRWVLIPEIETNLYGKNDPEIGIGSGLSDISVGLRLGYEIRREFAPYIGVQWGRQFGKTADYSEAEGEDIQFVAGIRFWF